MKLLILSLIQGVLAHRVFAHRGFAHRGILNDVQISHIAVLFHTLAALIAMSHLFITTQKFQPTWSYK